MSGKVEAEISRNVLLVGPMFKPARGGIAQVLSTYDSQLFDHMNFVANSSQGRLTNVWLLAKSLLQCLWGLLVHGYRIVHIHTASRNSYVRSRLFQNLAHLLGRKVVMHIHGGGFKQYYDGSEALRHSVAASLRKAEAVVVLSQEWKHTFEQDLGLTNLHCIANPIARPIVLPVKADGKVHILFMGLLIEQKGVFDLVEALSMIDESLRSQMVLHVCGTGDVERLNSLIEQYHLQESVAYEGWVDGERKNELLSLCEIVALPSYIEAMPLTILEGMSHGMAVFASQVGSIPAVVNDGVNGCLFNPGEKNIMASRLSELVGDAQLRARMGQKSAERAREFFPETIAQRLNELYQQLMN